MTVQGLTEDERDKVIERMIKMLGVERKHPGKKELEGEIIDYLSKKHPCVLATCGNDGMPRASVVDFMNDGLTIYILSEGGMKFTNIQENNNVSIGIGTSTKTLRSIRGVNIWGTAEIFADDTPEFSKALELYKPILDDLEKLKGSPVQMPPGIMRLIRVTPTKMVYHHYNKSIGNAIWEAE
jgi:nitroimidazol reductase NimA-like FMN-containing flavoprotein (pyridoxamine 5'-phosphate oxidase superfamily)